MTGKIGMENLSRHIVFDFYYTTLAASGAKRLPFAGKQILQLCDIPKIHVTSSKLLELLHVLLNWHRDDAAIVEPNGAALRVGIGDQPDPANA